VNLYSQLFRPALFRLDAEKAHEFAIHGLQIGGWIPSALHATFGKPPSHPVTAFGLKFPNPVGLAAGMDKNAVALPAWEALGFGFVEVGTITAKSQPGNPKPRLFRYPDLGALVNRLGFNNDGADVVAMRLDKLKASGRWPRIPVGINIGKSKATALEDAATDYLHSYRSLLPFADYFVVNVSSPNTPGLRELQVREALKQIIDTLRTCDASKPMFVKIAPDLNPPQIDEILALVEEADLTGLVVNNTTLDHSALPPSRDEVGGLSGLPLRSKATAIQTYIQERSSRALIASGGICDGKDGADRIGKGATLVQLYTGFVYQGPQLIRDICSALSSNATKLL